MPDIPINLGAQSRTDRNENTAKLINCFAESAGAGGRVQFPLYAEYGLKRAFALPYGQEIRGALTVRDDALGVEFLYIVSGNNLFKVAPDGTAIIIPQSIASGRLTMARNGKLPHPEIAICVDKIAYIVQTDLEGDEDTAVLITDADLPAPNSVEEVGGYFVFSTSDGKFYISGLNDGGAIDALDFDAADVKPDGIVVTKRISEGRLLVFGAESIETWRHTGDAAFPLERDIGTTLEFGTLSPASVATHKGSIGFVDSDGTAWLMSSGGLQKISTQTIHRAIQEVDPSTIQGVFYSIEGQQFYCISSDIWTFKYNISSGLWHECKSYNINRWRGGIVVQFNNKTLVCDYNDSRVYEMRADYFQEDDSPLILEVITPDQHAFPNRYAVNSLSVDMLVGTGLNTTDARNYEPRMMVSFTDDSGNTWSRERHVEIGRIGQTDKRVRMFRFGISRTGRRAWRFRIAAGVAKGLKQVTANIDGLVA